MDQQSADARKSGNDAAALANDTLTAIGDQAVQTKQQVEIMKRQIDISERHAQAAENDAGAAQIVAETAKISTKIAKGTLDAQNAFVQVASIGFHRGGSRMPLADNTPVSDDASVVIIVKNHGPTRAINTIPKGTLKMFPGDKFTTLAPQISYDLTSGIGLGVTFDPLNTWLDTDSITLLKNGNASLEVNLVITCADISREPHETEIDATLTDWIKRRWDSKIRST
jgi:hypothetical protein